MQYNACDQCQANIVSYLAQCFGFPWMSPCNICYYHPWALLSLSLGTEARPKVAISTD